MPRQIKIAVIEDDRPTNAMFASWLQALSLPERPVLVVQIYDTDAAVAALSATSFDVVCMDIELNHEKNAGVSLLRRIIETANTPVIVISGLDADVYRPFMKALETWDYLVKPLGPDDRGALLETVSRAIRSRLRDAADVPAQPVVQPTALFVDPLKGRATFGGKPINLPLTGQRIALMLSDKAGQVVPYANLMTAISTGQNLPNLRAHISVIRTAIRDVSSDFDAIQTVPGAGYIWLK